MITSFLGDSPIRVAIKLIILSLIVGFVMHYIGWSPRDVLDSVMSMFAWIWNLGFDAVLNSLEYLVLGAAVVVPVFLIMRILNFRSKSPPSE